MKELKVEGNIYKNCLENMNDALKKEQKIQMTEINSVISVFEERLFQQFHQKKNENYNLVR